MFSLEQSSEVRVLITLYLGMDFNCTILFKSTLAPTYLLSLELFLTLVFESLRFSTIFSKEKSLETLESIRDSPLEPINLFDLDCFVFMYCLLGIKFSLGKMFPIDSLI